MSDDPIDERDTTIERLQREVIEERGHSAQLRRTIDELRFKVTVLEKGYAKQLADARSRSGAAEQRLADHQAQQASLDGVRKNSPQPLQDARVQRERAAADARRPHSAPARQPLPTRAPAAPPTTRAPAPPAVRKTSASPPDGGAPPFRTGDHTINDLMATSTWLQSLAPQFDDSARKQPLPEAEAMLAPELVFPNGYDKDDKT